MLYTDGDDKELISADLPSDRQCCPKPAIYDSSKNTSLLWGVHPCCGSLSLKFDPWRVDTAGCTTNSTCFTSNEIWNKRETLHLARDIKSILGTGLNPLYDKSNDQLHKEECETVPRLLKTTT